MMPFPITIATYKSWQGAAILPTSGQNLYILYLPKFICFKQTAFFFNKQQYIPFLFNIQKIKTRCETFFIILKSNVAPCKSHFDRTKSTGTPLVNSRPCYHLVSEPTTIQTAKAQYLPNYVTRFDWQAVICDDYFGRLFLKSAKDSHNIRLCF